MIGDLFWFVSLSLSVCVCVCVTLACSLGLAATFLRSLSSFLLSSNLKNMLALGEGVRTLDEVSMWEQLGLAALLQRHWADNQVSCTVTFDPLREGPQLSSALNLFQYQLKGVSFLPKSPLAEYPQLPYQAISQADYAQAVGKLKGLSFESMAGGMPLGDSEALESPDKFCDAASCETLQQSPTQ